LAQLLKDDGELFSESEFGEMLEHLLASPLTFDMPALDQRLAGVLSGLQPKGRKTFATFGDVFTRENPPVELFLLIKDFAKASLSSADAPLPQSIANVLYFASIAGAEVRCGVRITKLDEGVAKQGFKWVASRKWVKGVLREVVTKA
jgi:hypothetical protein